MSLFDLFPEQDANRLDQALRSPNRQPEPVGVFSGLPTTIPSALESAVGKIAAPLSEALSQTDLSGALSATPLGAPPTIPQVEPQDTAREQAMASQRMVQMMQPDARTNGALSQLLFGVTEVGALAVLGTAAGGPLGGAALAGGAEGFSATREAQSNKVDDASAYKLGAVTGVASGVGVLMPILGKTLTGQLASGALGNVALGAVSRGTSSKVLADAGYHDMAEQYKWLDAQDVVTDAVLGLAFGGIHHAFSPAHIDTAMGAKDQVHLEINSSDGIPKTPEARSNHVKNMRTALQQKLDDQPVTNMRPVDTIPHPEQDASREASVAEVAKVAPEVFGERVEAPVEPEMTFEEEMAAKRAYEARSAVDFHEMSADEIYQHAEEGQRQIREAEDRILGENADKWRRAVRRGDEGTIADIEEGLSAKNKATLYGTHESELPASAYDELTDYKDAITDMTTIETPEHAAVSLSRYLSVLGDTKGTDPRLWTREQQVATFALRHIRDMIVQNKWNSKEIQALALQRAASRFSDPADAAMMLNRWLRKAKPETARALPTEAKALPPPVSEAAKAEAQQFAALQPETQEAVTQAKVDVNDMPELMIKDEETGVETSASEALAKAMDDIQSAKTDGVLHQIAAACVGRGL